MKSQILIVVFLVFFTNISSAYDPPEVLLRVETSITNQHCCLGDINGDGYEDFIIKQAPPGQSDRATFDIYYGGNQLSDEPGFVIPSGYPEEKNGYFWMVGHFLPDYTNILLTTAWIYDIHGDTTHAYANEFRLVSLDDSTLGNVLYSYRSDYHWLTQVGKIRSPSGNHLSYPSDFNNDGNHDLILVRHGQAGEERETIYETLQIYYGGADFDSIPDWSITRFRPRGTQIVYNVAAGYDVNGDDYDDMLVRGYTRIDNDYYQSSLVYEIYLGGDPMDTIPDWRMYYDHFENRKMKTTNSNGWAMLQDINDDGCDDWGLYYWESIDNPDGPPFESDGFYIFFGGEELDIEPDAELGEFPLVWSNVGEIIGGDFNEDGIGDIVCGAPANRGEGMIRYYFGREDWSREPEPDLEYRGRILQGGYGGACHGSVGDYNGDGADDYILNGAGEGLEEGGIIVVSGFDSGDIVTEPELPPHSVDLISKIYPNPFNNELSVSVELIRTLNLDISVYDVGGRIVDTLHTGDLGAGEYIFTWDALRSGIYFMVFKGGSNRVVHKAVCIR